MPSDAANPETSEQAYWARFAEDERVQFWFRRHEETMEAAPPGTLPTLTVTQAEFEEIQEKGKPLHELDGKPAWAGIVLEVAP